MKDYAKTIISNISKGNEEVMITVVHVSEVANVLKHGMPQEQLTTIIRGLFMLDNVRIMDVTKDVYFAATELGEDLNLEPNDAHAIDMMSQNNITEIFSFDEHFNKIEGITRIPEF
jgi:predicted nucleic acid-binding protein